MNRKPFAITTLFLSCIVAAAAVPPLFTPPVRYSTGFNSEPSEAAAGDLNGDGFVDLVTGNTGTDDISILLNDTHGGFQNPVSYPAGLAPHEVIVADFDHDQKLDVAVAEGSGNYSVQILLGNGDGTFHAGATIPLAKFASSMIAADFNSDGNVDLALSESYNGGKVQVLLGNGDGTFQASIGYSAGKGPITLAAGDLNRDGKLDLVVGNFLDQSVSILIGVGDGSFQIPVNYATGREPFSLSLADFNGDQNPDIAVVDLQSRDVRILYNAGDGTFGAAQTLADLNSPYSISASDLNGDGTADLAVSNSNGGIDVFLGDGSGNFAERDFTVPGNIYRITISDLDNDGKPDLVAALFQDMIKVLLNHGAFADGKLSTKKLTFPSQLVGTTSAPQKVTLTNEGTLPLDISSIVGSQNFITSSTCSTRVFIDATCNISVKFKPQKKGLIAGSVTITDNAFDSPQTISLTGSATVVSLSATSLDFGSIPVGETSPPQTVTLTNVSQNPLSIVSIVLEGSMFAQTNDCGLQLAGNATCTITVTFAPTAQGPASTALKISDNGGGSPQKVTLSGNGT